MAKRRVTVEAAPVAIGVQIADLQTLPGDALQARWRTVFGQRPPTQLPRHLLVRVLAYQLQAAALGDLSRETKRQLDRLVADPAVALDGSRSATAPTTLRPGTLLVREHGGVVHRVMVVNGGFAWQDATYASLSDVARAITGTRWNGPRFFGLRGKSR